MGLLQRLIALVKLAVDERGRAVHRRRIAVAHRGGVGLRMMDSQPVVGLLTGKTGRDFAVGAQIQARFADDDAVVAHGGVCPW